MSAIETHELTRAFASGVAVDHVTFALGTGEVLALLGPNGAGKTTTVRLLNGVLQADTGGARVLGSDPIAQGDEVRRRTGVLTENAGTRRSAHDAREPRVHRPASRVLATGREQTRGRVARTVRHG